MYSCNNEECAHDETCQAKCELEWHKEYLAEQKMVYEAELKIIKAEMDQKYLDTFTLFAVGFSAYTTGFLAITFHQILNWLS